MRTQRQQKRKRTAAGGYRTAAALSVAGLGLVLATVNAGVPAEAAVVDRTAGVDAGERAVPQPDPVARDIQELSSRVDGVTTAWADLADYYDRQVAPLERVLLRYSADTALAEHIAVALVRESNRVDLEPRLLLAVLLVENPWLDPDIRSPVGAVGLMQVMPLHRGAWGCGTDLEDVDSNICHGARIFAHYWDRSDHNLDRALLRYNGCVNGTNTPDCHQYPNHVFANAGRASVMAWMEGGVVAGAP